MKDFSIRLLNKTLYLLNLLIYYATQAGVYLKAIRTFLKQNECTRFKDCLLLEKVLQNQPRVGDRSFEYNWFLSALSLKRGRLLDIGSVSAEIFSHLPKKVAIYTLNLEEKILPRIPRLKSE